jgi:hypothetical protein
VVPHVAAPLVQVVLLEAAAVDRVLDSAVVVHQVVAVVGVHGHSRYERDLCA